MVLVSHDRALLDQVCTRLLILHPDGQHEFLMAWSAWRSRQVAGAEPENKAGKQNAALPRPERHPPTQKPTLSFVVGTTGEQGDGSGRTVGNGRPRAGEPEAWSDPEKLKSLQDLSHFD